MAERLARAGRVRRADRDRRAGGEAATARNGTRPIGGSGGRPAVLGTGQARRRGGGWPRDAGDRSDAEPRPAGRPGRAVALGISCLHPIPRIGARQGTSRPRAGRGKTTTLRAAAATPTRAGGATATCSRHAVAIRAVTTRRGGRPSQSGPAHPTGRARRSPRLPARFHDPSPCPTTRSSAARASPCPSACSWPSPSPRSASPSCLRPAASPGWHRRSARRSAGSSAASPPRRSRRRRSRSGRPRCSRCRTSRTTNQPTVDLQGTVPASVAGDTGRGSGSTSIGEGDPGVVTEIPVGETQRSSSRTSRSAPARTRSPRPSSDRRTRVRRPPRCHTSGHSKPRITVKSPGANAVVNGKTVTINGQTQAGHGQRAERHERHRQCPRRRQGAFTVVVPQDGIEHDPDHRDGPGRQRTPRTSRSAAGPALLRPSWPPDLPIKRSILRSR
jgi:hypothetical protein